MPDADDFDVEELRRLLRGEGPAAAPAAPQSPPPAVRKERNKSGPPAAKATGKPATRRKGR